MARPGVGLGARHGNGGGDDGRDDGGGGNGPPTWQCRHRSGRAIRAARVRARRAVDRRGDASVIASARWAKASPLRRSLGRGRPYRYVMASATLSQRMVTAAQVLLPVTMWPTMAR